MRLILIASLCLAPGAAWAQASPLPLTVEEAVALALRDNPRPRVAAGEVGAARAGVRAARSIANPSLTMTPTIVGSSGADDAIAFTQPLEVSGTRSARTRVARAELWAAKSTTVVTARDLVRDVKQAYYELVRAREVLDLQQQSVSTAVEFERIARRQVEVGTRPGIDLTQLQIELTRARQIQLQSEADLRLAAVTLNTLMGRPPNTPVAAVARLTFVPQPAEAPPSPDAALARRAEVAVEQARLEALQQHAHLIRAEGRPDLALGARLESFTSTPRAGGVGLGVTLPFLDYGSRRNRLRQTRQLADAQAARVEATRNQVRLEVESAILRLRTTEQLAQQYQGGLVDQARRLAEAERTRFQTGAGNPLSLLEAQRTYRSVISDYYSALASHEQAKAELEWALGNARPPEEIGNPQRAASRRSNR